MDGCPIYWDGYKDARYEEVRYRIMPRLQPNSIFERLDKDEAAHAPFVNDTILFMPHATVSITVAQMNRWGISIEEHKQLARANLGI